MRGIYRRLSFVPATGSNWRLVILFEFLSPDRVLVWPNANKRLLHANLMVLGKLNMLLESIDIDRKSDYDFSWNHNIFRRIL